MNIFPCQFSVGCPKAELQPVAIITRQVACVLALSFALSFCGCERGEGTSPPPSVESKNTATGVIVPSDKHNLHEENLKRIAREHFKRGYEHYRKGKKELAIKEYKNAIEAEPNNPEYYAHLGSVYDSMKRLVEARAMYEKSVELARNEPQYSYNLGIICMGLHDYKAAEKYMEAVKSTDSDFRNIHFLLGKLYSIDRKKYDGAIRELRKAIAKDPRSAASHYNLGLVYEWKAEFDKAESEYRRAIALDDKFDFLHYQIGKLLLRRGNVEEAEKEFKIHKELYDKFLRDIKNKEVDEQRHVYRPEATHN